MKTHQEKVGERIKELVKSEGFTAAVAATIAGTELGRSRNPKHESMGTHTAEVYRSELRVQAEAGNKHSQAMLEALEKGERPAEDPGGN